MATISSTSFTVVKLSLKLEPNWKNIIHVHPFTYLSRLNITLYLSSCCPVDIMQLWATISISISSPALTGGQTTWHTSQFSTFLRTMFTISGGDWCWCVVHASRAVREFGGCLFLAGCSADWLLKKTETQPDEAGTHAPLTQYVNRGGFHNFGPPSHATRHWFRASLRRYTPYTTRRSVTRIEEEVERELIWFSVPHEWTEMRERSFGKDCGVCE